MVFGQRLKSTRPADATNEKWRTQEPAIFMNTRDSAAYWLVALSTFKVTLGPIVELKTIFFM